MASATTFFSYDDGLRINGGDSGELGGFRGQKFCGDFKICLVFLKLGQRARVKRPGKSEHLR